MIELGGVSYYIDLSSIDKLTMTKADKGEKSISEQTKTIFDANGILVSTEVIKSVLEKQDEISITKLETINLMIDVIMNNKEELDASLGIERALANTDLPFQIAFNTLYNYKILREK